MRSSASFPTCKIDPNSFPSSSPSGGLIAKVGLPFCEIVYHQPRRKRVFSKLNRYSIFDMAMLGITQLPKVPLRFVTFLGFLSSAMCIVVGAIYFVYKFIFWASFSVGVAPVVIGMFLFIRATIPAWNHR